uniref:RING-type domain-containing protein n=1 Tax=Zooxanthella nutricula TaxID=1333877 RepID=A0A7S2M1K6_9DINO
MPAVAPPPFVAYLWKQGYSSTGLTTEFRWRWRQVELKDGCLKWSAWEGTRAGGAGELVAKGMVNLSLTPCRITKLIGKTQFQLTPTSGRYKWRGVPAMQRQRTFVFDAVDSVASRDEWCQALSQHVQFGRAVFKELAVLGVPVAAAQPAELAEVLAHGSCKECPICLDEFDGEAALVRTPCDHFFHEACARRWLAARGRCPMCRKWLCATARARGLTPRERAAARRAPAQQGPERSPSRRRRYVAAPQ